jgi:hypothetical protein
MADRLEREIDEILQRVDSLPAARKRLRPSRWTRFKRSLAAGPNAFAGWLGRLSVGHVMIAGFGLIVAGAILRGDLGTWLMVAGLVVLLTAFAVSISRGRRPARPRGQEIRWRGRVIEVNEPTIGDRMRGLWRRKKH